MLYRRLRLQSLMIAVLLSALVLSGIRQLGSMDELDWERTRNWSIVIGPFLILLGLKSGFIFWNQKRLRSEEGGEKPLPDSESPP